MQSHRKLKKHALGYGPKRGCMEGKTWKDQIRQIRVCLFLFVFLQPGLLKFYLKGEKEQFEDFTQVFEQSGL